MDKRQSLIYGLTGQEVELFPPEGVPAAAATYRLWRGSDANDQTPLFSGTATMDTTSLSLSAASGYSQANRRKVNLASTAGLVVDRPYILDNVDAQTERARLSRIASNSYAETEFDLAYDYTTTSHIKGFRQAFVIDATFIAAVGSLNVESFPFRVEWAYTVGGIARRHWTYFDVVRGAWQHGIAIDDLAAYWADVAYQDNRGEYGSQARKKIDAASQRVQMDLRQRGVDPNAVAEGPIRDELVRLQILCLYAREGKAPGGRDAEAFRRDVTAAYLRDLEAAVTSGAMKVSQSTAGGLTPNPVIQPTFRR